MYVYIVRTTDGDNLAVFSSWSRAEQERGYLDGLDELGHPDGHPLDETKIEEHQLDLSYSGQIH